MLQIYRRLFSILTKPERRRLAVLFVIMLLVAASEVVGVASIMPFIAVLADPGVVNRNKYLSHVQQTVGFGSTESFLFALGVLFLVLVVGSLGLKAFGSWVQLRYVHNRSRAWTASLVDYYLHQPYEWFLSRHSAGLANTVLQEVNQVVVGALMPGIQAIAQAMLVMLLVGILVAVDAKLALLSFAVLGGGFFAVSVTFRSRMRRIGAERLAAQRERAKILHEAFGGIKDVKIAGVEQAFLRRLDGPSRELARLQISGGILGQMPAIAMQAVLFGGIMLVLLNLLSRFGGIEGALPVVALYAFAGYRLMPAIQRVYELTSQLRFSEASVNVLSEDFARMRTGEASGTSQRKGHGSVPLTLLHSLAIHEVAYSYPNAPKKVLNDVSMKVAPYTTIALVGSTGSGKTTLVDIILGLLRPQSGHLSVDGVQIADANLRQWQRCVGYVPQHVFLSDDTIAANIAFGVSVAERNMAAVIQAAQVANLHSFVESDLDLGYHTLVGERGVRLSGGQRQRIGIARALYHDPAVLVLDEATSALDNLTEQAVMEAVQNLSRRKTLILIAHRLSTVRNCDCIYLLEDGRILAAGTYEELLVKSDRFRKLAESA